MEQIITALANAVMQGGPNGFAAMIALVLWFVWQDSKKANEDNQKIIEKLTRFSEDNVMQTNKVLEAIRELRFSLLDRK